MRDSVSARSVRTEANDLRSDLHAIRAGSHVARITVNPTVARDAFKAVSARLDRSNKELALTAGVPESSLCDAIKGNGRHLSADWILAQDETFVLEWWAEVKQRKGLTAESRQRARAERIGELVRLLLEEAA